MELEKELYLECVKHGILVIKDKQLSVFWADPVIKCCVQIHVYKLGGIDDL